MHGSVITVLTVHIEQKVSVTFAIAIIRMSDFLIVQIVEMIKMLKDQIVMVIIGANTVIVIAVIISLDTNIK